MNATVQDNSVLFPVGRIVQGDLYKPQDKDNKGNALIIKTGANAGKPRVSYFFATAIPKNPGETHWSQTQWGSKIYQFGMASWPTLFDRTTGQLIAREFAWKIEDGDDVRPNKSGRVNAQTEGHPGHWIVKFSSSFPVKVLDEQGAPLLQEGLVKRGFWVEVLGTIDTNQSTDSPGIYINHSMVAYRAPGKEISSGPDPRAVGFGQSALPPGVTPQPIGNTAAMPTFVPPRPTFAAPPSIPVQAAAPAAAVPVQAQPSFLQPPGVPPVVPQAPMPPSAPSVVCPLGAPLGFKMTNLNGPRYEAWKQNGWQDAQLVSGNHMVKL